MAIFGTCLFVNHCLIHLEVDVDVVPHVPALISLVSRQDGSSKSDGRQFFLKNDLKGHQGAVYAVQYSPNGKYLATGSFDKTVRIWDGTTNQNEVKNNFNGEGSRHFFFLCHAGCTAS